MTRFFTFHIVLFTVGIILMSLYMFFHVALFNPWHVAFGLLIMSLFYNVWSAFRGER